MNYLVSLILLVSVANAAKLPSYFKACSRKSTDFEKCLIENARNGILQIADKGDEKFKLGSLRPLIVEKIDLQATPSLKVIFNHAEFHGFDKAIIKELKMTDKELVMKFSVPVLELLANYDVKGQILVLPIIGNGRGNMTFEQAEAIFKGTLETKENNKKKYLILSEASVDLKQKQIYFDLKNLFSGDPRLGPEMNKFLNENWAEVFAESREAIETTLAGIVADVINAYLSRVPEDLLFE